MKKHILPLLSGALLLLTLAGCRETNDGTESGWVTATPAPTPYHTENALEKGIDKANEIAGDTAKGITDGAGEILEDMGKAEQKAGNDLKNGTH